MLKYFCTTLHFCKKWVCWSLGPPCFNAIPTQKHVKKMCKYKYWQVSFLFLYWTCQVSQVLQIQIHMIQWAPQKLVYFQRKCTPRYVWTVQWCRNNNFPKMQFSVMLQGFTMNELALGRSIISEWMTGFIGKIVLLFLRILY